MNKKEAETLLKENFPVLMSSYLNLAGVTCASY